MDTTIARPIDVAGPSQDEVVAIGFLARYREPTRTNYALNLRQWFDWCETQGVRPLSASRAHIEVYARLLEERRGLKLATVANKLNTIAGYYKFARIDKVIADDPAEYLRRPSVPRVSTTQGLTRAEALRCLDLAEAASPQDHALWCLLVFNGLRIGEALALSVEDLGRTGGYRTIKVKREKGNRDAEIPMAPRTSWAFDNHLGSRVTGPLFRMKPHGDRMNRLSAAAIVKRIVKAAGIEKRITPHSLRHAHITMGLNAGVSVRDLTNSMGYADARQISYYDRDKDALQRNATHMISAFVEGG